MKNKGYLLTQAGQFQLVEASLTTDKIPEHSTLIQIEYCGICGGDYSCYLGRRPGYPKSLGHEFVGTVLSVGGKVSLVQVGDFVVSDLNYRCGECEYCKTGKSHLCTYNNAERFTNRAFFQYTIIDETYLYRTTLPPTFLYRAALIEPLSCVIHSYDQLKKFNWSSLLINGCGSIGTLLCFYLTQVLNARNLSVYDINYHRSSALSKYFGVNCVRSLSEEMFDSVYECTNSTAGMEASLQSIKRNGVACIFSHIYGEETSFIYEMICRKELQTLFPLRNGSAKNIRAAIHYIETYWQPQMDRLIGIYTFDDFKNVFRKKNQIGFYKQVIKMHMV